MAELAKGHQSSVAVRTRYFDDAIENVLNEMPIRQVVLPAAGMDARSFRLDLPQDTSWYELDQPELITVKEQILGDVQARPRCQRHVVSVDLTSDWTATLLQAGMQPDRPTLWVVEGLLCYLTSEAVGALLDSITELSAPGSRLFVDVLGSMVVDRNLPWLRPWLEALEEVGMGQQFGTDDPESLFEPRGWHCEVTPFPTVASGFGRWPSRAPVRNTSDQPKPRPSSFLVQARR